MNQKLFLIEIKIEQDCWDYKIGQTMIIPVITNNSSNALRSFEKKHCGSEYPTYEVLSIIDTSKNFIFAPNMKSKNLL